MSAVSETLTVSRRLSPEQSARRTAAIAVARRLAQEGGYVAVTMQAVAEQSGVGRATLYRYFASKDHLLAEVVRAWGAELAGEVQRRALAGTPGERLAAVLLHVVEAARAEPRLTSAVLAAATSADPEALRAGSELGSVMARYLDVALGEGAGTGDPVDAERGELAQLVGHVLFSALVHMTSGRLAPEAAAAAVTSAARRLFPEEASR